MILVQQFHNNRFFILLGSALLLLGVLFLLFCKKEAPVVIVPGYTDGVVVSGDMRIAVSIADSPQEREQGLSNTSPLLVNTGKFFVFEESGYHGFWMKDMNYSIDIIWLDESMSIVSIAQNVSPESFPEVFYPAGTSMYVLEAMAGFSTIHGLEIGQSFTLEK